MTKEIVLVTGSSGRIGSRVIERLSKKYTVIGLELFKAFHPSKAEETIPLDLSNNESVTMTFHYLKKFYGVKIASVIHLAAYYSFKEQHSPLYDKITVQGTERLLQALQNFEVEQFLFTSTMLVHAPTYPGIPISEDSLVLPTWDYPASKVKTEKLIRHLRGNIPALLLRIAGVYDDECHSIPISEQIRRIYEKQLESRFFAGNIHHGASFVHMEDLLDAIEVAVEKRTTLPSELPLLIGEPKTLSYDTLQRKISSLLFRKEFSTFSLPKWLARIGAHLRKHLPCAPEPFIQPWMIALADDHYELDIKHAQRFLGWKPKRSLKETLPKMIQDLERDPKNWYRKNGL